MTNDEARMTNGTRSERPPRRSWRTRSASNTIRRRSPFAEFARVRGTIAGMDNDRQEPPVLPAGDGEDATPLAGLASHTTLRSLFVATAAVAVWASLWRVWPPVLVHWLITPCAACFVSALLGAGLSGGFAIGFAAAMLVYANSIMNDDVLSISLGDLIRLVFFNSLGGMWMMGLTWATAVWWGVYLRYVWSNPVWPRVGGDRVDASGRRWTVRERLVLRCAETPGQFVLVSIVAEVFMYTALWWIFVVAGRS